MFLNAGAGLSPTDAGALARALGKDRVHVRAVAPRNLERDIAAAVARHHPVIGIAGGDGTLRTAARILAGTASALLPVPTGTLNTFARRAGIHSAAQAGAALDHGRVVALPVGTMNGDVFLNTLTIGEYSRVVRMRESWRTRVGKWPAALLAFIAACATLRRVRVTLNVDGHTFTRRTPFLWVGMGWGSFPRVDEARERRRHPDLELAIVRSSGRAAAAGFVLRMGVRMLRRERPIRDRLLEVMHTRRLELDSHHRVDATADGEVLRLRPPVRIGIRDDALRVLTLQHPDEHGSTLTNTT